MYDVCFVDTYFCSLNAKKGEKETKSKFFKGEASGKGKEINRESNCI